MLSVSSMQLTLRSDTVTISSKCLLGHPVVRHANSQNEHRISLHEPGSRGDADQRIKFSECRQCPRIFGLIVNRQR